MNIIGYQQLLQVMILTVSIFFGAGPADAAEDGFEQDTILKDAGDFFGSGAEGLADVISKIFKEHGKPNAYIKGTEASGALVVGARYGDGTLYMKNGNTAKVYWTGPSVGFDAGGNLSKVYALVYHLPGTDAVFQRFPAVEGSIYYIGGVGVSYHQVDKIILAPMRLGVGLRAGVNLNYMHIRRDKSWNPF